jgi:hypothetical protein
MTLITSRAEWLASLKVGDVVGVLIGGPSWLPGWIGTVSRFTKAGKIWVSEGDKADRACFTPDGERFPTSEGGCTLITADVVERRNARILADACFRDVCNHLGSVASGTRIPDGFDHEAHTATIRAIVAAIKGKKP